MLRFVNGNELVYRFYFHNDALLYQQVDFYMTVQDLTLVRDWNADLTVDPDTPESKLPAERSFVYRLE